MGCSRSATRQSLVLLAKELLDAVAQEKLISKVGSADFAYNVALTYFAYKCISLEYFFAYLKQEA